MIRQASLGFVLLAAIPLWCQVDPSATGVSSPIEDSQMMMPPPVSGLSYPSLVMSEERSNFLEDGAIITVAHNDNVLAGGGGKPVSDMVYSIFPNINLGERTPRRQISVNYGAGFTFYQPTTVLDSVIQNGTVQAAYRLTPGVTVSVQDRLQQNSSPFTQPYTADGGVTGSGGSDAPFILAPFANQVQNSVSGKVSYQFGMNGMVGGSGFFSIFHYTTPSQVVGLYDSKSGGGSGFYVRRLSQNQYLGGIYEYRRTVSEGVTSTTQDNGLKGFYTRYFGQSVSISVTGGYELFDTSQPGAPTTSSWRPTVIASAGWQKSHTNFALTYERSVSSGQGLVGAYSSNGFDLSARWQPARRLTFGVTGRYANLVNLTPNIAFSNAGGHTVSGVGSVEYKINEHFDLEGEYGRLHQTYAGIAVVSLAPDSNRFSASFQYRFSRSLGR